MGLRFPHRGMSRWPCAVGFQVHHDPSSTFHTSSTGKLHQPCGFISPHCHVQGSPSGVFPPPKPEMSRRHPVPSRRWRNLATGGFPSAPRSCASPSGPCSSVESVAIAMRFSHRKGPIPSWSSPPPGALPRRRENAFTLSDAHDLGRRSVESSRPWSPACYRRRDWLTSLEVADLLEVTCLPPVDLRRRVTRRFALTGSPLRPPMKYLHRKRRTSSARRAPDHLIQ